jgi:Trypsin-co-occurring domain 1
MVQTRLRNLGARNMGSRLIEFPVASGSNATIKIEVQDDAAGNVPVARTLERATRTFEEVIGQVRPAIDVVMAQMQLLAIKPETTSVEFGIKLSAGADAWIAKTAIEGNLKVTFTFKK